MGRVLILSDEALQVIHDIAMQRALFDRASGMKLLVDFLNRCESLVDIPFLYRVVYVKRGVEFRRFLVENVTVVYTLSDDAVKVAQVFGPGHNWLEGTW